MNGAVALSDQEFALFQAWVYRQAGIALGPAKKSLVTNRLLKRVIHHGLESFAAYYRLVSTGSSVDESRIALDLLTTNETYFFREPKHFEFLANDLLPQYAREPLLRIWSAASSSGEEAYSIAMTLAARREPDSWEILGSDLSTRVLAAAARAQYPMERAEHIPRDYLKRYCLKGVGAQAGTFRIAPALRERVSFGQVNLNERLPTVGQFDVIFLRNVLIYFDAPTKCAVVKRLVETLKPGGHLFIGHSESLHGFELPLEAIRPAIYRKS